VSNESSCDGKRAARMRERRRNKKRRGTGRME
jgi:hypothetical protein